jgi:hypothetical protein
MSSTTIDERRGSYHRKHSRAHLYQILQGSPLENGKGGEQFEQSGRDIELDISFRK